MLKQIAIFKDSIPYANVPYTEIRVFLQVLWGTSIPRHVKEMIYSFVGGGSSIRSCDNFTWEWKIPARERSDHV